jgi:hypothetical protein
MNNFISNSGVEVIDGLPLNLSSCVGYANNQIHETSLKEIRFVPSTIICNTYFTSAVLSDDSIQSIIDGLADLTGSTAQTLTLHATVGAKLTQAQKDAAAAKNWTLVY